MFFCGFSGDYCGQSSTDDVNPATKNVILAFVNTLPGGAIIVDDAGFPYKQVTHWQAKGKNVIISVGGQNGNWGYIFASEQSIDAFIKSIVSILNKYNLDGIDLDL